ncbi:MAG TPA: hypothetical protein VFV34_06100 [Blastocatellia bacterium]|nr:hypothetical protein [Blastocatellia bacterium]
MDLSFERWERITSAEREATARILAKQLPSGFSFNSVQQCRLGEQKHEVAFFKYGDSRFVLIPDGSVVLGYDAGRTWSPNRDELESWKETNHEYGFASTVQEYIAEVTLRPREVALGPFLVETAASELGWDPVPADDPEVQEILRRYRSQQGVVVDRGGTTIRVQQGNDGTIVAERSVSMTHSELARQIQKLGFRFPTSDEWEFACGGSATTLFRWGDHVPCDRYPTDVSPAEAEWRRQWVLSRGTIESPPEPFVSDWDYHRQPNCFGLLIASDPYEYELLAEVGMTRGSDGGVRICGGMGFFVGWLPLATSYYEAEFCKMEPTEPLSPGYTYGRRVLELR